MPNKVTLVRAGMVVPSHDQPALSDAAVAVENDRIVAVGTYKSLSNVYQQANVIGGEKYLLIPGLINGHSHGRGLTDFQRGALDNTLESWLLDTRKYLPVDIYYDCALSAIRLLKAGVTTTMHNHILKDPTQHAEEHDQAIKAYSDAGMRVQFNPGVRNANPFVYGDNTAFLDSLPPDLKTTLSNPLPSGALSGDNFVAAVKELHLRHAGPFCRIGFGPLAPQWATDDLLLAVRQEADNLGAPIHVHAVQSIFQKLYGLKYLGKTLIEHMQDIGFLGPGLVIGHCVWPTEADIELLAESGTGVTHHPSCNLRVRNGISPAWHMLKAGVTVGLGLDGKSINDDDDFIQEMKVCYLLHRLPSLELHSAHMTARQVFQMATENSAKLLGFGDEIGRLEPGRRADLVLLDYHAMTAPYVDPAHDPIDVLLYRGTRHHVDSVMMGGRLVVQDGTVTTLDEDEIGAELAEAVSRPRTENEQAAVKLMDQLQEYVIHHYRGWSEEPDVAPFYRVNSSIDGFD